MKDERLKSQVEMGAWFNVSRKITRKVKDAPLWKNMAIDDFQLEVTSFLDLWRIHCRDGIRTSCRKRTSCRFAIDYMKVQFRLQ